MKNLLKTCALIGSAIGIAQPTPADIISWESGLTWRGVEVRRVYRDTTGTYCVTVIATDRSSSGARSGNFSGFESVRIRRQPIDWSRIGHPKTKPATLQKFARVALPDRSLQRSARDPHPPCVSDEMFTYSRPTVAGHPYGGSDVLIRVTYNGPKTFAYTCFDVTLFCGDEVLSASRESIETFVSGQTRTLSLWEHNIAPEKITSVEIVYSSSF